MESEQIWGVEMKLTERRKKVNYIKLEQVYTLRDSPFSKKKLHCWYGYAVS